MKNISIIAGEVKGVRINSYDNREFLNLSVSVEDPSRSREDGTPFTYRIPVNISGPQVARLKDKISEGKKVVIEGRFEPTQREGKAYYTVNATSVEVVDGGSMNRIVLQARLVRDPEVRQTTNGNRVCSVPVCCTRSYKDKNDEWHDISHFITVIAWGDTVEKLNYEKGKLLWLTGKLTSRKWTDKEGQDHYPVEVVLETISDGGTGRYKQDNTCNTTQTTGNVKADNATEPAGYDGFSDIPDGFDEELPFD